MNKDKQLDAVNRNCTTCAYYTLDRYFRGVCTLNPSAGYVDARTVCPQWIEKK